MQNSITEQVQGNFMLHASSLMDHPRVAPERLRTDASLLRMSMIFADEEPSPLPCIRQIGLLSRMNQD